jgi:hypothetical protein
MYFVLIKHLFLNASDIVVQNKSEMFDTSTGFNMYESEILLQMNIKRYLYSVRNKTN